MSFNNRRRPSSRRDRRRGSSRQRSRNSEGVDRDVLVFIGVFVLLTLAAIGVLAFFIL